VVIYLSCQLVHGVTAVDFFISDTDAERVDALIDLLLEALADAPFDYSEHDCVAALVGTLREILKDAGPPVVH
jgi:hypothetical protein